MTSLLFPKQRNIVKSYQLEAEIIFLYNLADTMLEENTNGKILSKKSQKLKMLKVECWKMKDERWNTTKMQTV